MFTAAVLYFYQTYTHKLTFLSNSRANYVLSNIYL